MTRILQATCHNGELILTEKLDSTLEGKTLKIMILVDSEPNQTTSPEDRKSQVAQFLEKAQQHSFKLPSNYRFDRDEIYDR
jgi:hypothetical protein